MIVRQLKDIEGTERDVKTETWASRRLILRDDQVGFSVHDTIMKKGTDTMMWYKNHIEAVYCIEGEGEIEDLTTGTVHRIAPGTLYLLNNHDKHRVRPKTDLRMVCVFNPACTGQEVHDQSGAYPLLADETPV
ncbi:MAG: ectoine synthase [Thermaerobacter sp.]|nr:ectoine synthase [Thermaerobacter sp.]